MGTDDLSPWPPGAPPAPALCDEESRASVLAAYGLDALEDDPELAQITGFAAKLCEAPVALVSLVEEERQRFLARTGLEERETPRPTSFCAHAMLQPRPMVVPDAREDERFSGNPLVTGHPHIRFYAGAPLISHEGAPLGSLCVIDTEPRADGLSELQSEGLETLAAAVMRRLRYRREVLEADERQAKADRQLALMADAIPDIAWSCDGERRFDYYNARWREFTGSKGPVDADGWSPFLHPDDQDDALERWARAVRDETSFESEYRMKHVSGDWRWVLSRAQPLRNRGGDIVRWFGTVTDIDASRRTSDQRDLLARELSHRIKNIFAVVAGLVALRARKLPEARPFADELTEAIRALGRAHDYVRPFDGRKSDMLIGLIEELMAPYRSEGDQRIAIAGEDCEIGARAATPMALVFHELATNSAKYGALSNDTGTIRIEIEHDREEGTVTMRWCERGGPPPAPDADEGFGSRLVKMSVENQLQGTIERRWAKDGVDVDLCVPLSAISS